MAFVLAVLGGAAAVEISKLLHKDTKVSAKDLQELQSKEEELKEVLQEVQAELRQERAAHEVDSKRVQELSAVAEQLQIVKAELEQESTVLKSDKQALLTRTEALLEQQAELCSSTINLKHENISLAQQLKDYKLVKEGIAATVAKNAESLKASVVSSFEKFAHGEIDGKALLQEFNDIGLDVNVTAESLDALPDIRGQPGVKDIEEVEEQMNTKFDKQLRLVSDSPDRLFELMRGIREAEEMQGMRGAEAVKRIRGSEEVQGSRSGEEADVPSSSSRVPALNFPTLKSPPKDRKGAQMFKFLSAVGLTPRQEESSQSKVPALNLSSVGYQSPAKSPHRALRPTAVNSGNGTSLVFSKAKKEGKKGSKYTVNLGGPTHEKITPRKATTPRRSRSSTAALDFHDSENQDPFSESQELMSR